MTASASGPETAAGLAGRRQAPGDERRHARERQEADDHDLDQDRGPIGARGRAARTRDPQLGHDRETDQAAREDERRGEHDADRDEPDRTERGHRGGGGQDERFDRHAGALRGRIGLGHDLEAAEEDGREEHHGDRPDERIGRESRQRDHHPDRDRKVSRP